MVKLLLSYVITKFQSNSNYFASMQKLYNQFYVNKNGIRNGNFEKIVFYQILN